MYAALHPFTGNQPFNDWFVPDTTQRHVLGTRVAAVDPYWGYGEFLYVKSAAAILKGSLVQWDGDHNGILLVNTANTGFCFGVAMNAIPSGSYGWIMVAGSAVYKTNATVAAEAAIGVAAAGILGTNSAGKQALGIRNNKSATATKTVTAFTTSGSALLQTAGYDGFFLGMALSGTGIPASTVVAALGADGRTIYTGSAIGTVGDKNATASGSITLTGTYTGYGQGTINHPFIQGAIT
jgi:hypothetical protein